MTEARHLTHGARRRRRREIERALRQGEHAPEIAARFGLSRVYVGQIAKDAGIAIRKRGRPRGTFVHWPDCPPHLHDFHRLLVAVKKVPAREVREMLEACA